jgi:hypothetical protein
MLVYKNPLAFVEFVHSTEKITFETFHMGVTAFENWSAVTVRLE